MLVGGGRMMGFWGLVVCTCTYLCTEFCCSASFYELILMYLSINTLLVIIYDFMNFLVILFYEKRKD